MNRIAPFFLFSCLAVVVVVVWQLDLQPVPITTSHRNMFHIYIFAYYLHCMVRATATVVWCGFRFSRKNNLTKEVGLLLTYFNLCKGDKKYRVLYYFTYAFPCKTMRNLIFVIVKYRRNQDMKESLISPLVDFVVFCCHSVYISESKPLHDDSLLRTIFSLLCSTIFN